ncbi:MAG: hypothetical protein EPO21_21815 [Chloroflexota bacterium]|nr:MAG: hypothetical protein EPO21_21815 [Chloroflexota bacterium]
MVNSSTSKELVRSMFAGKKVPRPRFMPFAGTFAAALRQIPVRDMLEDPTLLANSLQDAQALFSYDTIATALDSSLEAEACGCEVDWEDDNRPPTVTSHPLAEGRRPADLDLSGIEKRGRLPIVLEAIRRLSLVPGKHVALAGTVTGPVALARHLMGDCLFDDLRQGKEQAKEVVASAAKVTLSVARAYCDQKVDVIVIADEALSRLDASSYEVAFAGLRSVTKVIRFYGASSVFLTRDCTGDQIRSIASSVAGLDGIAADGGLDLAELSDIAARAGLCFGASIPSAALLGSLSDVTDRVRDMLAKVGGRYFLTTGWEIPMATPAENIHALMAYLEDSSGLD